MNGSAGPDLLAVALGSNLGDRLAMIHAAFAGLRAIPQTGRWRLSRVWETPPVDVVHDPDAPPGAFLNAVAVADTDAPVDRLFAAIQQVEASLGRTEKGQHRSRPIDLDLLAVGDRLVRSDALVLPHPRLQDRAFVLLPMCDVAGEWRHPILGQTPPEMLAAVRAARAARSPEDPFEAEGMIYADGIAPPE